MKITKIIGLSNQNENKGRPSSKSRLWNKKNKKKNITRVNKNSTKNYCKEKIEQGYNKKNYAKLMLNIVKVIDNSTSIGHLA
jgi:hypothetical protein